MAKQKGPAALKSRVIRISLPTYWLLKDISENSSLSMAEILDKLIAGITARSIPITSAGSTPAFRVTGVPAFRVTGVPAFRVTGVPAIHIEPVTTIATNGSKAAAFRIKPKGASYA